MTTTIILAILVIAAVVRLNIEHHKHLDPHSVTRGPRIDPPGITHGRHSL